MMAYKKLQGVPRKRQFQGGNIDNFLDFFKRYIETEPYLNLFRDFCREEILPVIEIVAQIIQSSDISDDVFFDPGFLVDT
jgi:hypothetical protein